MYERTYSGPGCEVRLMTNHHQEVRVTSELDGSVRIIDSRDDRLPRLPLTAAAASLVAAATHAFVVRSHAAHWWGYAAFFLALAIAQAIFAVLIVRRPTRRLAFVGIGATLALLALYVWSRLVAVPFGPHSGSSEAVGPADLIAVAAELIVVGSLALILRGTAIAASRFRVSRSAATAILAGLVAAGMAGPAGHAHPKPSEVLLSDGPETWVGPLPTESPLAEASPLTEVAPTTKPEPTVEPETPRCDLSDAEWNGTLPAARAGEARGVVYATYSEVGSKLSVYLPGSDSSRTLLSGKEPCWINHPSFRDTGYVSFHSDRGVYGLDLAKGSVENLVTGNVMASSWSPDGRYLAYLDYDWSEDDPKLVLFDRRTGEKNVIRTFESNAGGRCGSEADETTITWAPDGHALIVVMTFLDPSGKTMFVVDRSGDDLVAPRFGTHALWAPNSKRIYYRDWEDGKWFALNSDTGDRGSLAIKPWTHGLSISPDGSMLAYHDGEDDVGIYIYDVAQKEQRRLTDDAVRPVWIGPRTILVTNTKSCGDACFHSAWESAGTASTVDVFSGRKERASLGSTLDADAWLEEAAAPEPDPTTPPSPTTAPSPTPSEDPIPIVPTPEASTEPTPSSPPTA